MLGVRSESLPAGIAWRGLVDNFQYYQPGEAMSSANVHSRSEDLGFHLLEVGE